MRRGRAGLWGRLLAPVPSQSPHRLSQQPAPLLGAGRQCQLSPSPGRVRRHPPLGARDPDEELAAERSGASALLVRSPQAGASQSPSEVSSRGGPTPRSYSSGTAKGRRDNVTLKMESLPWFSG